MTDSPAALIAEAEEWLRVDGHLHNHLVQRLVLAAFVGPAPAGHEAAHDDGIGHHNWLSNLSWKTRKANNADKLRHGTQTRGESHHRSKLTEEKVREIRAAIEGTSPTALAARYGVTLPTIKAVRSRATWGHVQ